MIIFFLFNIYIYIYIFYYLSHINFCNKNLKENKISSYLVVFVYFVFFIVIMRLLKIFSYNSRIIDLKKILLLLNIINYNFIFLILLNLVLGIFLFFFFKNKIIEIFKFNIFSIYFSLFNTTYITKFKNFLSNFDVILFKDFYKKYPFLVNLIIYHGFKIVLFSFFLYDIIFNNFELNLFLTPWYGIYYIFLSFIRVSKSMKPNFDFGVHVLMENFLFLNSKGYYKVQLYKSFLISGKSDYVFLDIYFDINPGLSNYITFDIKSDTEDPLKYFKVL